MFCLSDKFWLVTLILVSESNKKEIPMNGSDLEAEMLLIDFCCTSEIHTSQEFSFMGFPSATVQQRAVVEGFFVSTTLCLMLPLTFF